MSVSSAKTTACSSAQKLNLDHSVARSSAPFGSRTRGSQRTIQPAARRVDSTMGGMGGTRTAMRGSLVFKAWPSTSAPQICDGAPNNIVANADPRRGSLVLRSQSQACSAAVRRTECVVATCDTFCHGMAQSSDDFAILCMFRGTGSQVKSSQVFFQEVYCMAMQTRSRPTTGAIGVLRKGCSDGPRRWQGLATAGAARRARATHRPFLDEF